MTRSIKVVIVSDNHGDLDALTYVKEKHSDADYFIHCGDAALPPYLLDGFAVVQGNNDLYNTFPSFRVLEIGNHRLYVVHGHHDLFFGSLSQLKSKADLNHCNIVCFGHTHSYQEIEAEGVLFLNPGSIHHNRDGTKPSYMIVTFHDDDIKVQRMTYEKT